VHWQSLVGVGVCRHAFINILLQHPTRGPENRDGGGVGGSLINI
jgi:hypothetical protein